jgi:hypothetical protein
LSSWALIRLRRATEAEDLLRASSEVAEREGALGYQAQLAMKQSDIDVSRGQLDAALTRLTQAATLARHVGGNRLIVEIDLEIAAVHTRLHHPVDADLALQEGVAAARRQGELFLLPRLLAERADIRTLAPARYTLTARDDRLARPVWG